MVSKIMSYHILACGQSDVGLVRQNNEDFWAELPALNFYALADGMGGHRGGEVASHQSIMALMEMLNKTIGQTTEDFDLNEMHGIIQYAIEHANEVIHKMAGKNPDLRGMGTTLCCLLFCPQGLVYAHVGDSRIYRLRRKKLEQLTKDDSLIRQLKDAGKIKDYDSGESLYKGIITKAIGTQKAVDPSVHTTEIKNDDLYMMCSDGLSDLLSLKELEEILNETPDIKKATHTLIEKAKQKGGFDNITVVLTKVQNPDEA